MAEFTEVIRKLNYMCEQMDSCSVCPMDKFRNQGIRCDQYLKYYPQDVEHDINNWYKENR